MSVHSDIQTIEQASKICGNQIGLTGELTELTIDIHHDNNDNAVSVRYVGVVDTDGSYIRIQGSTHNALVGFESTIKALQALRANIMVTYSNGEKIEEKFQDTCSLVYVEGRVSSAFSVIADYISVASQTGASIIGYINGVAIEEVDYNIHKILIITNSYHNIITFRCVDNKDIITYHKTINFAIRANRYNNGTTEPIYLEAINELDEQINDNIIQSAIQEHEMYVKTWKQK